ncbi:hypothetical protein TrST_g3067 [Triparma strigata]|uniref:Cyclic nucleotide-binding domain-containing protein n=1 Tax=Triparma strigata TaxID=1606541 RepID=A0A9W7AV98_9STRA|nr:hypothetical protein TrST_g3067 [Triparma strigata]
MFPPSRRPSNNPRGGNGLYFLDFRIKKIVYNRKVTDAEITDVHVIERTGKEREGYVVKILVAWGGNFKVFEVEILGNIVKPFGEKGVREGKGWVGFDGVKGGRVYWTEGKEGLKGVEVRGGDEIAGLTFGEKIPKGSIVSTNPILVSPTFLSVSKTSLVHIHPPSFPPITLNLQSHVSTEKTLKCYKILESSTAGWIVGTNTGIIVLKPTPPKPQCSLNLPSLSLSCTPLGVVQKLSSTSTLEPFISSHVTSSHPSPLSSSITGLNNHFSISLGKTVHIFSSSPLLLQTFRNVDSHAFFTHSSKTYLTTLTLQHTSPSNPTLSPTRRKKTLFGKKEKDSNDLITVPTVLTLHLLTSSAISIVGEVFTRGTPKSVVTGEVLLVNNFNDICRFYTFVKGSLKAGGPEIPRVEGAVWGEKFWGVRVDGGIFFYEKGGGVVCERRVGGEFWVGKVGEVFFVVEGGRVGIVEVLGGGESEIISVGEVEFEGEVVDIRGRELIMIDKLTRKLESIRLDDWKVRAAILRIEGEVERAEEIRRLEGP